MPQPHSGAHCRALPARALITFQASLARTSRQTETTSEPSRPTADGDACVNGDGCFAVTTRPMAQLLVGPAVLWHAGVDQVSKEFLA